MTMSGKLDDVFKAVAHKQRLTLSSWEETDFTLGPATAKEDSQPLLKVHDGRPRTLLRYKLTGTNVNGSQQVLDIVVKIKGSSQAIVDGWVEVAKYHGEDFFSVTKTHGAGMGFEDCSEREYLASSLAYKDSHFSRFIPRVYYVTADEVKCEYVIVMEFLGPSEIEVGGTWESAHWSQMGKCKVALTELARFHAPYLGNTKTIEKHFQGRLNSIDHIFTDALPFWRECLKINIKEFPHLFNDRRISGLNNCLENYHRIAEEFKRYPLTFVQADVHPGNIWLRKNPDDDQSVLCMCDWELCGINTPQQDSSLFIFNSLMERLPSSSAVIAIVTELSEHYRTELLRMLIDSKQPEVVAQIAERDLFQRIFDYQALAWFFSRGCIAGYLPPDERGFYQCVELLENSLLFIDSFLDRLDVCQS